MLKPFGFMKAPVAASLLPFTDDFSTDTSADYTLYQGAAGSTLVVSAGVASATENSIVYRDLGLAANCRARVVIENPAGISSVCIKITDAGGVVSDVRGVWNPSVNNSFVLEKRVSGVYTNVQSTLTGQTVSAGDILELEAYNSGALVTMRRSTDGGATFTDLYVGSDISDVPASPRAGFRVTTTGTITEFSAADVV